MNCADMPVPVKPLRVVIVGETNSAGDPFARDVDILRISSDMFSILAHREELLAADAVLFVDDGDLLRPPADPAELDKLLKAKFCRRHLHVCDDGATDESFADDGTYCEPSLACVAKIVLSEICSIPKPSGYREVWMLVAEDTKNQTMDDVFNDMLGSTSKELLLPDPDEPNAHIDDPFTDSRDECWDQWADVRDLAARLDLRRRAGQKLRFSLPKGPCYLAKALGKNSYMLPLRPQKYQTLPWDEGDPNSGPVVGFVAFGNNNLIRTVWIDISGATVPPQEIITECLKMIAKPSADQKVAMDNLREAKCAKAEVEAMLKKRGQVNPLVGESEAMLLMYPEILEAAQNPRMHVMVVGETGSGKEALYDLLKEISDNKHPFEIRQIQGYTDNTLYSEIFGHTEGAFTGATKKRAGAIKAADGGTLVLDNLQTAGFDFFPAFLRVLEPKQEYQVMGSDKIESVKCRIVAGFNIRPEEMLKKEQLPPDWLARFDIRIDIPNLNDRRDDIRALVSHFIQQEQQSNPQLQNMSHEQLMPDRDTLEKWTAKDWSGAEGNVRGLRKTVCAYVRKRVLALSPSHSETESAPTLIAKRGRPSGMPNQLLCDILQKAVSEKAPLSTILCQVRDKYNSREKLMKRLRDLSKKKADDSDYDPFFPVAFDYVKKLPLAETSPVTEGD